MSHSTILPANLRVLKARFPSVYNRIMDIGSQVPLSFKYQDGEGTCTLLTKRGGEAFSTYGSGSREDLLQRWMDGLEIAKESLYAISGFGDGSHVQHFLDHSSGGTHFIVAEEDPALLRETLSRFDCSNLLANERLMLGVGEPDEDFFRDIQTAALTEIQDINMVIFSPLHSLNEAYYDRMRNELVRQYLVVRPDDGSEPKNRSDYTGKYI